MTRAEIDRFCFETNTPPNLNKALIAKKMSNAIEKSEYVPGDEAVNNFKKLFERILSYIG